MGKHLCIWRQMVSESVIRVAWQTAPMRAKSYFYYHQQCFAEHRSIPGEEVVKLPIEQIGCDAMCTGCLEAINPRKHQRLLALAEMAQIAQEEGAYD